jgi:hypothetical protein
VLVRMSASMPNNPIENYLTFGKSDVIHSTILAFAQMAERRSTLRDLGSGGPRAEGVKGSSYKPNLLE